MKEWRICPSCGYVRTTLASTDITPCARCGDAGIADTGQLYHVLVPARVNARDRRDDARIGDDEDDRETMAYATTTTVDMGEIGLAASWRHRTETFGVDYTRHAVVRRFNLGRIRYDSPANHRFAGDDVRINPFHACTTCGGTTSDGPPQTAASLGISSGVGHRREDNHHRPWCPGWRGTTTQHDALVLAHELGTEAIRMLVPAVAALVEERILSFQAALRLGIAARYGGDPDHLRTVRAYMPDRGGTGELRQFVVLFDIQPGGTGYLHRLADPDEFQHVLSAARHLIADCVCAQEGRAACHRCLLRYAGENDYSKMSKQEAMDLLDRLLRDWSVDPVGSTEEISLIHQVESELEAKFLQALLDWGARSDTSASITKQTDRYGARYAELRFSPPDGGPVTHWRMKLQNTIRGTRPDVHFVRLDAAGPEVAVYLDGFKYHASSQYNRLADDAMKRGVLRAQPIHVFAITWKDVERWSGRDVKSEPVWPPYQENGKRIARQAYTEQLAGRNPDELNTLVWTNPIDTLLAYLANPDTDAWRRRATAALTGLLTLPGAKTTTTSETVGAAIKAALAGTALPSPTPAGGITVVGTADINGCPLALVVDARARDHAPTWTALAIVDDRPQAVNDTDPAYERRWAAWLYWGNLIQFLTTAGGDGDQVAASTMDTFEPAQLAVSEGTGLVAARRLLELDPESATWLGREPGAPLEPEIEEIDVGKTDPGWRDVPSLLVPGEAGLESLVRGLIARVAPPPVLGYELGEGGWQAELAWPGRRIAVVLSDDYHHNHEAADRDRAYAEDGWDARTAKQWSVEELLGKLTSEGSR